MSERLLKLVIGHDNRRLRRDFSRAGREASTMARGMGSRMKAGFAHATGGLAALATGAGLAAVGQQVLQMNEQFTRMGIQAKLSTKEMAAHGSTINRLGLQYGLGRQKIQEAVNEIVNLQGASAMTQPVMALMAKTMAATGGSGKDIAQVVSALADAGIRGKEAEASISAFIEAGDQGSVPFARMGGVLAGLIPKYQGIVATGKQGAAQLGGMLQVMGKVTGGDVGEAKTLMKAMVASLKAKRARLQKEGFGDLFDKKGTLKSIDEIRPALARLAQHKDVGRILGREEAATAVQAMAQFGGEYERIVSLAATSNAVNANSMKFLNSEAGRLKIAMAEIQARVQGLFTRERIAAFVEFAEFGARGAGLLLDNLGKVVLVVGAIKAIQLGRTIRGWSGQLGALLAQSQQVGGMGKALGGTFAKVAGKLGTLSIAAGVLTAAFTATSIALEAAGYEEWLDKVMGVSGSKTVADEDRRLTKKLTGERERHDKQIAMLAAGRGGSDRVTQAAQQIMGMQLGGMSDREITAQAPDAYKLVQRAGQGRVMSPDALEANRQQLQIYQRRSEAADARQKNERMVASLRAPQMRATINKRFREDADKLLTFAEVQEDARKRYRMTPVQEEGQSPEQARLAAEQKTNEIAQQIWGLMKQQAQEYGYDVSGQEIVLKVDGDVLARANSNALDQRRSEAE